MTYTSQSTRILVLGHLRLSTNYLQGHPMDLFLKMSFLQANFCRAGRFGNNAMSLKGTCCWEIVNSGCLRGFRKDVAM